MKVARNVVETLKLLIGSGGEISVSEVSQHLGLDRSTASRLLASLCEGGLVERSGSSAKYTAGYLALQLSAFAQSRFNVIGLVSQAMGEIVERTGHTTCLGILDGTDVLILQTRRNEGMVQVAFDVGSRFPAHASAMGKVLLADLSEAQIATMFPARLPRKAAETITDRKALLAELQRTREQGYGKGRNEVAESVASYAVALHPSRGPALAVGVAFLAGATDTEGGRVVEALQAFKSRMESQWLKAP